jgi:hypothetical protein
LHLPVKNTPEWQAGDYAKPRHPRNGQNLFVVSNKTTDPLAGW